jgi:hypothetical protein
MGSVARDGIAQAIKRNKSVKRRRVLLIRGSAFVDKWLARVNTAPWLRDARGIKRPDSELSDGNCCGESRRLVFLSVIFDVLIGAQDRRA